MERGFRWRLFTLHQVHLSYHLVALFAVLYGLFCAPDLATGFENARLWTIPVSVLVFGALGGVLRGLYWLYRKVQTRTFRPQLTMPELTSPWIGLLFGALVYLLMLAGVMTFGTGASGGTGGGGVSGVGPAQLAAAFLAGYSWEWVLK